MGHVIQISNLIVNETSKPPFDAVLAQVDNDILGQWNEFVATALTKVNGDQNSGAVIFLLLKSFEKSHLKIFSRLSSKSGRIMKTINFITR